MRQRRLAVPDVVRGSEAGGPAPMIVTSTTGCSLIDGQASGFGARHRPVPAAR